MKCRTVEIWKVILPECWIWVFRSSFLMKKPINAVPVVTLTRNLLSLLIHQYNFVTAFNHIANIYIFWQFLLIPMRGSFHLPMLQTAGLESNKKKGTFIMPKDPKLTWTEIIHSPSQMNTDTFIFRVLEVPLLWFFLFCDWGIEKRF